ncbi:Pentatricopeptide repeat-containing protein, chloroplastic [Symbiodinium microadriaticum]|uniref:Pentatricopeptide repeat-containing protein, chloroplastic n=1 Tax=Symbiodinium microadriaticum TaxID=2951 RepID=A0A1Q9E826_SYMMI|nr:Pentatricopeptide repeat-containing protein, chloroplastic [Symbiodinium microadriaticum]
MGVTWHGAEEEKEVWEDRSHCEATPSAQSGRLSKACSKRQWRSLAAISSKWKSLAADKRKRTCGRRRGLQWERALALLFAPEMRPSVPAFNAAISACAEASRWPKALELFGSMEALPLQPDVISCNTAIFACQMAGQWSLALSLLAECGDREVERDLITFNSSILACEKRGRWREALALFTSLMLQRLQGDLLTYNGLLRVCAEGSQWRHVLKLLSAMDKEQLQGNAVTYDAAVRASEAAAPIRSLGLLSRAREGALGRSGYLCEVGAALSYRTCIEGPGILLLLLARPQRCAAAASSQFPGIHPRCPLAVARRPGRKARLRRHPGGA